MSSILEELKSNSYLKLIIDISKKYPQSIYLVGGYLRDLFLKRKRDIFDFDFAVSSNAINVSKEIARFFKSGFVVLDKEHGSSRIVYRKNDTCCNFDFTDFRSKDIFEDVLHRDFTINGLAVNIKSIYKSKNLEDILIDPYDGRADIKKKTIREISKFSLLEDPVRILRAFSLMATLDFKIENKTRQAVKKYRKKISSCAVERIAEELFKTFNTQNSFKAISLMDDLGVIDTIIPEVKIMRGVKQGPYHHLDVYRHSLETLRQLEILLNKLKRKKEIQGYLKQIISGTHTRLALLKLGAFLHDIGKPEALEHFEGKTRFHGHERIGRDMTRDIAERLRLSCDERDSLSRMVFWHLRPGYLADIENVSQRAVYRYFRDTKDEGASVLLLSMADQRATRGVLTKDENRKNHEEVCLGLVKEFFRRRKEKRLPRLINGHDLIRHLKLSSGPLIGDILLLIEEAQAMGEIKTKQQALKMARKLVNKKKGGS